LDQEQNLTFVQALTRLVQRRNPCRMPRNNNNAEEKSMGDDDDAETGFTGTVNPLVGRAARREDNGACEWESEEWKLGVT
jgi:hypothetical protein